MSDEKYENVLETDKVIIKAKDVIVKSDLRREERKRRDPWGFFWNGWAQEDEDMKEHSNETVDELEDEEENQVEDSL